MNAESRFPVLGLFKQLTTDTPPFIKKPSTSVNAHRLQPTLNRSADLTLKLDPFDQAATCVTQWDSED